MEITIDTTEEELKALLKSCTEKEVCDIIITQLYPLYQEKVERLERICTAYESISVDYKKENKIYKNFLKELKVLADKNNSVKIINMINGLDL